jgi:hypothetical protein
MDTDRILKAKGQFNLKVQYALKHLELYTQKPFMDQAVEIVKMLDELAIYEAAGEQPPEDLMRKLMTYQNTVEKIK